MKTFIEFINESLKVNKPIWNVEKHSKLESIATLDFDPKLTSKFLKVIEKNVDNTKGNLVKIALEGFSPVEVTVKDGPKHEQRCFLSSLEFNKDDERNLCVVGILRRKGTNHAWVHAFNKNGETYFDNSLSKEEIDSYFHYPLGEGFIAKDEEAVATIAWIHANSLQKAVEEFI